MSPQPETQPPAGSLQLGDFEVDLGARCLRLAGEEVHLREQSFEVLVCLLDRPGRLVPRDELMDRVWGEVAVTADSLVQCVAEIRKALGDDPRRPRYVRTVPRRGYRLVAPVREEVQRLELVDTETITSVDVEIEEHSLSRSWFVAAAAAAVALAVGLVLWLPGWPTPTVEPSPPPPAAALAKRRAVLVTFLENRSQDSELEWMRGGLADMLITGLSRSGSLAVVSRQQVARLAARGRTEPPDAATVDPLTLGRRAGAEVVVTGSFSRIGDAVRIDVHALDVARGELIAGDGLVAERPEEVLSRVDELAWSLVAGLEGEAEETAGRLGETMTESLDAYRLYSLALEAANGYHTEPALALLRRALEIDSDFVMARARIGYVLAIVGWREQEGKPYLEEALRARARLTEQHRRMIAAWHATASGDFERAITAYRVLLDRYPLDLEAYWRLAYLLRGEERQAEAVEVLEAGLELDPVSPEMWNALGMMHADLAEHEQAIAAHRRYVDLDPQEANAWDSLGMSLQWAGRYEAAEEAYAHALTIDPAFGLAEWHRVVTRYLRGHYRETLEWLENRVAKATDPVVRAFDLSRLGWARFFAGDEAGAREVMRRLAAIDERRPGLPLEVLLQARDGRLDELALEATRRELSAHGRRASLRFFDWARGYAALVLGQEDEAVAALSELVTRRPGLGEFPLEDALARALVELERWDEAIVELERILTLNPRYPLAHYLLGRALEGKGEAEQARVAYERFLEVWAEADPDIPELVDARRRLAG